jgi:hypothetical protein
MYSRITFLTVAFVAMPVHRLGKLFTSLGSPFFAGVRFPLLSAVVVPEFPMPEACPEEVEVLSSRFSRLSAGSPVCFCENQSTMKFARKVDKSSMNLLDNYEN